MASEIAAPKPDGSRRQSDKKTILKHFLKGLWKGKLLAPKLRKSADKSLSQPWCSHSNTIYDLQLQKTIVLRMQPLRQATLTRQYNAICRDWVAKHNRTTCNGVGNCSSKTGGSRRQSDKKTILKHFLKGILKGKLLAPKLRKSADKSLSQPWCSHSNTIYDLQLQKTIVLRMQPLHQATLTQPLQCDLQRHNRTTCNGVGNCSSKTGWISTPKRQKDDFEALFKRNFKRKIISAKIEKICWQITFAALMQPFQYDLRSSAAKDNSITHAAAAPSNLDAATTMRSATTASRNA